MQKPPKTLNLCKWSKTELAVGKQEYFINILHGIQVSPKLKVMILSPNLVAPYR